MFGLNFSHCQLFLTCRYGLLFFIFYKITLRLLYARMLLTLVNRERVGGGRRVGFL